MFLRAMVTSLNGDTSIDSVKLFHVSDSMTFLNNFKIRFAARSNICLFGVFDIQFAYWNNDRNECCENSIKTICE
jgi:hypothetical protein